MIELQNLIWESSMMTVPEWDNCTGYVYSEQLSPSRFQDQNVDWLKMLIILINSAEATGSVLNIFQGLVICPFIRTNE